jgi:hypothetical protein
VQLPPKTAAKVPGHRVTRVNFSGYKSVNLQVHGSCSAFNNCWGGRNYRNYRNKRYDVFLEEFVGEKALFDAAHKGAVNDINYLN